MADLKLTIGVDNTELKKGISESGKTIQDELGKTPGMSSGILSGIGESFKTGGMAGGIGAIIGTITALGDALSGVAKYIDEVITRSREIRNVSNISGMSEAQVASMDPLLRMSGMSIGQLGHSFTEFNKRIGEARIKGSEVNNLLYKMGVNMKDVSNGSYTAIDAIKDLALANEAGTDASVLAYYGNKLFGSSFESLIPLIKLGSNSIQKYGKSVDESTNTLLNANARIKDDVDSWSASWDRLNEKFVGGFAVLGDGLETFVKNGWDIFTGSFANLNGLEKSPEKVAQDAMSHLDSKATWKEVDDKAKQYFTWTFMMDRSKDEQDRYWAEINRLDTGRSGNKLNPFGLAPAGGVSSMQSMGGGDLFGAIAFSPLDAIKDNTERTASSLEAMMEMETGMGPSKTDINLQ